MNSKPRMIYQTDETRTKILTVARNLFTEKGLFDTQMLDVAEALGMSRTTLYRYYQDKLDLALAILHILMAEVLKAWDDPGPSALTGRDRLGRYLREIWSNEGPLAPHLKYFAEFDAFFSGSRIPEGFREKLMAGLPVTSSSIMMELITAGQADGSIRADINPHLAMATLFNTVRGLQQRVSLRGDVLVEIHPCEMSKIVDELIGYLLVGISPHP